MENEENVVRLAKPVKKGLLRLVFSRFCLIALLLVLQIALLIAGYGYLTDKLPILLTLARLFSVVMIIYLFNCDMDSSAKLTWMLVIAIVPVVGTINLDYRSLYHHFECATYLYKTDCIAPIEEDFRQTLAKCRAVTPETIKAEKTSTKLLGLIAKLISPLM